MQAIKKFLGGKSAGFYGTVACLLCLIVALICFGALTNVSTEATENPATVIALAVVAMAFCALTAFKDYFKIPSLLAFVFTFVAFAVFVSGRVSYVAFYFSGDVMNTGLSPLFVVSFVFFLLAAVASASAVCLKQEKVNFKEEI